MTIDTILTFLHILAASVILGGEIFLQFIVYPVLLKQEKQIKKDSSLVKIYDIAIPVIFGLILVIIITGALSIFKSYHYFQDAPSSILIPLAVKIGMVILLLAVGSYQTFSLRIKMTGLHLFQKDTDDIAALAGKGRICSIVIIISAAAALFMGINMSR